MHPHQYSRRKRKKSLWSTLVFKLEIWSGLKIKVAHNNSHYENGNVGSRDLLWPTLMGLFTVTFCSKDSTTIFALPTNC